VYDCLGGAAIDVPNMGAEIDEDHYEGGRDKPQQQREFRERLTAAAAVDSR
jgi:hypothetical protein